MLGIGSTSTTTTTAADLPWLGSFDCAARDEAARECSIGSMDRHNNITR